ncbi:MAG: hypothetical protein U1F43_14025 [Myxococcota bacterium]
MTSDDPAADPALDRAGHLSLWALERVRLDAPESDPPFFAAAEAHLAGCAECRALMASMAAEDPALTLAPPPARGQAPTRVPAPPRRLRRNWLIGGAGALMAAAATLAVVTAPPDATRKGSRFDFEVHIADGKATTRVDDGAVVHPGDRAGFEARAEAAGFILIFGWDERGAPYPAYPASGLGAAQAIAPTPAAQALPAAIQFDAVGAAEHFAAVYCPSAFAFADLVPAPPVREADVRARSEARGCVLRTLALRKVSRP